MGELRYVMLVRVILVFKVYEDCCQCGDIRVRVIWHVIKGMRG